MRAKTLTNIISVFLFMFFFSSCEKVEMKAPPKLKPYPAPAFTLADPAGEIFSLSDYKGKPVIINFWATWCVPCVKEMPELEKLYRDRKAEGLELLAINIKESKDVVKDYIKKGGFTFRVLLDEKGDVSSAFQVFGLPSTFFIDKEGIIRYSYMGELTWGITKMGLKSISVIKPSPDNS